MNKPICLHLSDNLIERLDAVAATEQRSRSNLMRLIVERHLDEHARAGASPVYVPPLPVSAPAPNAAEAHLARHAALGRTATFQETPDQENA